MAGRSRARRLRQFLLQSLRQMLFPHSPPVTDLPLDPMIPLSRTADLDSPPLRYFAPALCLSPDHGQRAAPKETIRSKQQIPSIHRREQHRGNSTLAVLGDLDLLVG